MPEPKATLYIKNIDWKIKKGLLRRALYSLFSRHGKVLEIVALRKDGLRGQAFVIMDSVQAATAAMQADQGFTFFGKDLVIEYAKETSDRIARRDGTYVPKAKRQKLAAVQGPGGANAKEHGQPSDPASSLPEEAQTQDITVVTEEKEEEEGSSPPSKYLLADGLPPEVNTLMLEMLFRQYAGFKEVRMPRQGLFFIEFDDDSQAAVAKQGLNGFLITATQKLKLAYGKN
jgi:RNA recognition motif-containing protein